MNTTNRTYEALYIVDATLADDQVESVIAKYSKVIADQGGDVQAAGRWDKRRLAYDVKGHREGTYILMYFTGGPASMNELDRLMRIADDVFRHIIVRVEPQYVDTSRIDRPPAVAEAPAERVEAQAPVEQAVEAEAPAAEVESQTEQVAAPAEQAEPVEAEAAPEPAAEPEVVAEEVPAEEPAVEEAAPAEEPVAEEPAAEGTSEETSGEEPNVEPKKESE